MRPVISIVGRPNVGKSTLYNRLTRSRDALVDDFPGVTRDRMIGVGRIGDQPYWVVDTGGLVQSSKTPLQALLTGQVETALMDSDAVVMMVDGRAGANSEDREIAEYLRRHDVPLFLACNKTEGLAKDIVAAEFFDFGLLHPPHPISAKNGDGVRVLMQQILSRIGDGSGSDHEVDADIPRIGVLGRPNVGKSTLTNRLLGEERMVVYDLPGTTRDSVYVPFVYGERDYILVDTAGVRRRSRVREKLERFSIVKTLRTLDDVQVVILVLDAQQGLTEQDAKLAGLIIEHGRSMVVAINKWDGLEGREKALIKRSFSREMPFLDGVPVLYLSAKYGSRMGGVMPAVGAVYASAMVSLPTSKLNNVIRRAIEMQPPPRVGRRQVKLKYAHQVGKNPPTAVIHGNLVHKVPDSYKRYLANSIRKGFKLTGTRVNLAFRTADNPFAGTGRAR